jgi:hypothetical protein
MSPKRHEDAIQHSSVESGWRTQPELFEALDAEFHFTVDLAASCDDSLCETWLGPGAPERYDDSQLVAWAKFLNGATGFLNPPYSKKLAATYAKAGDPRAVWYRVERWVQKCWAESYAGATVVSLIPYSPQTRWWRRYVLGHRPALPLEHSVSGATFTTSWAGHAASQIRRFPHRLSFLRPDGAPADDAGGNTAVVVWTPMRGAVGPWVPWEFYWTFRGLGETPAEEPSDADTD